MKFLAPYFAALAVALATLWAMFAFLEFIDSRAWYAIPGTLTIVMVGGMVVGTIVYFADMRGD